MNKPYIFVAIGAIIGWNIGGWAYREMFGTPKPIPAPIVIHDTIFLEPRAYRTRDTLPPLNTPVLGWKNDTATRYWCPYEWRGSPDSLFLPGVCKWWVPMPQNPDLQ